MVEEAINNCHGCKWLDEITSKKDGSGYCCMVERSKTQYSKVRYPTSQRCELYEAGCFATRWSNK